MASKRAKRSAFGLAYERKMLEFLVSELKDGNENAKNPFGNVIWRTFVQRLGPLEEHHSVQSVTSHFRRHMWPYLKLQPIKDEDAIYLKKMIRNEEPEENGSKADDSDGELVSSDSDVVVEEEDGPNQRKQARKKRNNRNGHCSSTPKANGVQVNGGRNEMSISSIKADGSNIGNGAGASTSATISKHSKGPIYDMDSLESRSVLLDMAQREELPFNYLPTFTAKMKKASEIATKLDMDIDDVVERAYEHKSLTLVEKESKN